MYQNMQKDTNRRQSNYSSAISQMFHNLEYQKDLAKYKSSLMNDVDFLKGVTLYLQQAISLFWKEHENDIHNTGFDSLLDEEELYMIEAFNM